MKKTCNPGLGLPLHFPISTQNGLGSSCCRRCENSANERIWMSFAQRLTAQLRPWWTNKASWCFPCRFICTPGPDEFAEVYNLRRPEFSLTGTPRLSYGLNLGAQLFRLQRKFPREFARVRWILPYPQYWTMRLCCAHAADPTMLGAHADLWIPGSNQLSDLAKNEGWSRLIPDFEC